MWVISLKLLNDTLEIERHNMFNFSFIIPRYGFHFRSMISSTKPIHKIPGQFVNKPVIRLFCDRPLLSGLYTILWFVENVGRIWNILFVTLATVELVENCPVTHREIGSGSAGLGLEMA